MTGETTPLQQKSVERLLVASQMQILSGVAKLFGQEVALPTHDEVGINSEIFRDYYVGTNKPCDPNEAQDYVARLSVFSGEEVS